MDSAKIYAKTCKARKAVAQKIMAQLKNNSNGKNNRMIKEINTRKIHSMP